MHKKHFIKPGIWQWDHLRASGFGKKSLLVGWLHHTRYAGGKSAQLLWASIQGFLHALCPWFMPFWAEKDTLKVAEQIRQRMIERGEL